MENPQQYYREIGPMTTPGTQREQLAKLPRDIAGLCEVIQGIVIHRDMAPFAYDVTFSEERRDDAHLRSFADILKRVLELDHRPITTAREKQKRFAGVCRHFTVVLCAMLREQGIPARARCGFGAYFNSGKFEDHWVCEYWNAKRARWMLVDAQLDAVQKRLFKPDFDTLDVPHDRFIIAGDAWQMCRSGRAEPDRFGLSHVALKGMWFIAGNVLRDFASLNRMELLPWDVWGLMPKDDSEFTDESNALVDQVAALTLAGDEAFPEIRKLYESDQRVRVPPVVVNALRFRQEAIATAPVGATT